MEHILGNLILEQCLLQDHITNWGQGFMNQVLLSPLHFGWYTPKFTHGTWISFTPSRRKNKCVDRLSSVAQSYSTLWDPLDYSTPGFPVLMELPNSWNLLKLTSIESVMPPSHLILCHSPLFWPSILPRIRVFSNESSLCIRWPKCS